MSETKQAALAETNEDLDNSLSLKAKSSWFDKLLDIMTIIACGVIVAITLLVFADVFLRYAFNSPFRFTMPVTELALLFVTCLSGTWLLREEGFVTIDLVTSHLKPKVRGMLSIVTMLISGIFMGLIAVYSVPMLIRLIKTKATLSQSGGTFRHAVFAAPVCVFFFLLTIQCFRNALRNFRRYKALQGADTLKGSPSAE